ncbi:hypothetical protein [Streptomyces buecherae]|uniref:Uncharacterized protein n=1 Tax=Streptomyces buecherae TaxID=2763006 RepID=A0A7H8NKQ6_9ACTN|nr:hypothetical protein [Streptomyces buecherae]QKW55030.1 hypothetical protein HUT08_36480 [Streptomyces buecherae]
MTDAHVIAPHPVTMTPHAILRACQYMDAVWRGEQHADGLVVDAPDGAPPMAVMVVGLGDGVVAQLAGSLGEGGSDQAPTDPTLRVSMVLMDTLRTLAPTATPDETRVIALSVIAYWRAISNASIEDVPRLLAIVRDTAATAATGPRQWPAWPPTDPPGPPRKLM